MSNWNTERLFSEGGFRTIDNDGPVRSILFSNEPYLGQPTEVFAYLGVPDSADAPVPGMVCVHGGGGKAFKNWVEMWVERGYAAISMDFSGRGGDGYLAVEDDRGAYASSCHQEAANEGRPPAG